VFGRPPICVELRNFRGGSGYFFINGDPKTIAEGLKKNPALQKLIEVQKHGFEAWLNSSVPISTDDWPYLYLERKSVPSLFLIIFGMLALLFSISVRKVAGPEFRVRWNFFFLGAGFLLLEVQNISKFALLLGTTWIVNTFV